MLVRQPAHILTLVSVVALVGAACGSSGDDEADPSDAGSDSAIESGDSDNGDVAPGVSDGDGRSDESIDWSPCAGAECGTVAVPADYDDESAGTIDIAVSVHRATGADEDWLGYLFVNPGGPGGPGIEFATAAASGAFSQPVLERFDIVGFDPRGVGDSEPSFTCGSGAEYRSLIAEVDGEVDTDLEIAAATEIAGLCEDAMGPVGNRLHTAFVANDMDLIRQALGADQISYYGASYGSTVGAWFATLHPSSVRAMVVDGADNPIVEDSDDVEVLVANQLEEVGAFETQLGLALEACTDDSCAIYNDGDPEAKIAVAAEKLDLVQEASLSGASSAALIGVITPLYAENRWVELYDAIASLADDDDAGPLAALADEQLGDTSGPTITSHVNCLDSWALQPDLAVYDPDDLELDAQVEERLLEELPLVGQFVVDEVEGCPFLGDSAPAPFAGEFDGAGVPILVIGNTSDPATPFVESEELALEVLSNGYLVTVEHPSHVVYPGGFNACVTGHVEAMLIDAQPPAEQVEECGATEGEVDQLGGLEPAELVEVLCFEYAGALHPDADPEAVASACADAPAAVLDALGPDLVMSIAGGADEDRVPELLAVLDQQLAEVGIG